MVIIVDPVYLVVYMLMLLSFQNVIMNPSLAWNVQVTAARFLDAFALCLSQNSQFAGSLHKLILSRPSSTGYLPSIAEMKATNCFSNEPSKVSEFPVVRNNRMLSSLENVQKEYELPRMPPWFVFVGSQKLYQSLAGILRLVGLSLVAGCLSSLSLNPICLLSFILV